MTNADTVLFAIRAGLTLYGAIRKAYADGTRGRSLVLPLPRSAGIASDSARSFFRDANAEVRERFPRAATLADTDSLSDDEQAEITTIYRAYLAAADPDSDLNASGRGLVTADELSALVTIRQWESGRCGPGEPTAVQRVAGTLVNLAVDWFLETPGAVNDRRPAGRALRSFLTVLDGRDFATAEVGTVAPGLLVGVLESVSANPDLFGGGENEQALVTAVTASLAGSASDRLAGATADELHSASAWLGMAARALLDGGAEVFLANPRRFLDLSADESALVTHVGRSVADLVIGEAAPDFRPLLTKDGLSTITRAALEAVAANPAVMKIDHQGVTKVLAALARDVAKLPEPLSKDIFPEVARLTLEASAENLDLLWGPRFTSPDRHLLVTATRVLVSEFARKPPGGSTWRPRLTGTQLTTTLEAVIEEVVDNPAWLMARAEGESPVLAEALGAALAALRRTDGARVSADAGISVLQASLRAVALQITFLDRLPPPAGEAAKTAIEAALDAIFGVVFTDGANVTKSWKLASNSVLVALVETALSVLSEHVVDAAKIEALAAAVREEMAWTLPFDPEDFAERLRERLEV